jgi:hypothetical protein
LRETRSCGTGSWNVEAGGGRSPRRLAVARPQGRRVQGVRGGRGRAGIFLAEDTERGAHRRPRAGAGRGYGRLLHGEAVAIGWRWEAVLGRRLGVTEEETRKGSFPCCAAWGTSWTSRDPARLDLHGARNGQEARRGGRRSAADRPAGHVRDPAPSAGGGTQGASGHPGGNPGSPAGQAAEPRDAGPGHAGNRADPRAARGGQPEGQPGDHVPCGAYRKSGNTAAAWEAIQEVLGRDPSDHAAQRVAAELERSLPAEPAVGGPPTGMLPLENLLVVGENAYGCGRGRGRTARGGRGGSASFRRAAARPEEIRVEPLPVPRKPLPLRKKRRRRRKRPRPPAGSRPPRRESPAASRRCASFPFREDGDPPTFTGRRERGPSRGASSADPRGGAGQRARPAWMAEPRQGGPRGVALGTFLEKTAKEYGYDLSRYH